MKELTLGFCEYYTIFASDLYERYNSLSSTHHSISHIEYCNITYKEVCFIFIDLCFFSEPVECKEPILVVSHKVGVCRVSPGGKPCTTVFTKLHGDGLSSVVKCKSCCIC